MDDPKRVVITGRGVAVRGNDIDTDRIIPARYLRCVTFDGLGEHLMEDDRRLLKMEGKTHPIDEPAHAGAEILFVNKNFGCGSSREHAPQALMRWGIRAIVGESFAEIFFGNCVALGIPCVTATEPVVQSMMDQCEYHPETEFSLSIADKTVQWEATTAAVELDDAIQRAFLDGRWDTTAELLANRDAVAAVAERLPYIHQWR